MPKSTFNNLAEKKQKAIIQAFMKEFTLHSYDKASLSKVVEQLGIAKGSIYQYFGNKQELFLYLVEICNQTKASYLVPIKRADYPDYWTYFVEVYKNGLRFDAEHPMYSHFLFSLTRNLNSPSVKGIYDQMMQSVVKAFEELAHYEVQAGLFRTDISLPVLGYMLYKFGASIQEYLQHLGIIDPIKSIEKHEPIYFEKEEQLMQHIHQFISLAKPAFNKRT